MTALPRLVLLAVLLLAAGCRPSEPAPGPEPQTQTPRQIPPPTILPVPERLVAVGDVHGDHSAMVSALALAGVIDDGGHWSGGETSILE